MNAVVSVASVGSAAAIASPSIVARPAGECSMPDLAAKFAALYQRFRIKTEADRDDRRQLEMALFEKTGIIFRSGDDNATYPEWYDKERSDFVNAWPCADPELTEWTTLQAELWPIANDILERPAISVADVTLQAQAAALLNNELWLESHCVELYACCPSRALRMLADSVANFGGSDTLPGLSPLPVSEVFFLPPERGGVVASDPVLDVIERHSAAATALRAAPSNQDIPEELNQRERDAFDELWQTRPTTRYGLDVYLTYLKSVAEREKDGFVMGSEAFAWMIENVQGALLEQRAT